jgi:tetratricopeptide (TPR) repeat protein
MPLGLQFLTKLTAALKRRQIAKGINLLTEEKEVWVRLDPRSPHSAELLLCIAQWVDVGYRDYELIDLLLKRFSPALRRRMPFGDYFRLRMVEAFRALCAEDANTAIAILEVVIKAERELADAKLMTLAHFWKARSHRKKGEYDMALHHLVQARSLTQKSAEEIMLTAVIQIQESWLLFQKGLHNDSLQLLGHAEAVLKTTDYDLALGNIESARGRIVRRAGQYTKALAYFDRAIAIYSVHHSQHRNLARTLVNAAYTKRLLALQLQKRIDARARRSDRSRAGGGESAGEERGLGNLHTRYNKICRGALVQLELALEIYALHGYSSGIGSVLVNAGHLHLDSGDIESAAQKALEAYKLAVKKNDQILMARARMLQAATEHARVQERLGEDEDIELHADTAKQYCDEAIALAQHTQNRRLLAGAYIMRGLTAASDFFQEWDVANECAAAASALLGPEDRDHLIEELSGLKMQVLRACGINDTLRAWSEGVLGDKTFRQVSEEFAEIVIPKVWMRENRTISRVAERLSISPKKVRRVLRNAGLSDRP